MRSSQTRYNDCYNITVSSTFNPKGNDVLCLYYNIIQIHRLHNFDLSATVWLCVLSTISHLRRLLE